MDYNLEKTVKYEVETELKSLYGWSLVETEKDAKKSVRKLIPFEWGVYFLASKLAVVRHITIDRDYDADDEEAKKLTDSSVIIASLHSGYCNDGKNLEDDVNYRMFGTDRNIESFELKIYISSDGVERCGAWATPSYDYEINFRNRSEADTVEFHMYLNKERWESIEKLVHSKSIDALQIRFGKVSGFYSEWSPEISTRAIKILTKSHTVEGDSEVVDKLPKIGDVGEFTLTTYTDRKLNIKRNAVAKPIAPLFEDDFDMSSQKTESVSVQHDSDTVNAVLISQISELNSKLISFKKIIWAVVVLLFLILLK